MNLLVALTHSTPHNILVTGSAGFIGSYLTLKLHEKGYQVTGIDNFDSYYSVALKRKRAQRLADAGVEVIEGNICNSTLLRTLFLKNNYTHIVNLAARPGVRYTFIDPLSYVENNVKCFTQLLEQMRLAYLQPRQSPKLLYASSSSVYGLNTKIPYSESDPVNSPTNLYGATKRMNELIAFSYRHLFNISSAGFRFFTVYGPLGRPDMATNIFIEKLLQNETITLFNNGELVRDFTFIDDIVAGLVGAIERSIDDQYIVYNLGNSKPIKSIEFLRILEGLLGRVGRVRYEDSPADMPMTFANTSLAAQNLGFEAKISVEEGLKRTVAWFKQEQRSFMPCESECSYGSDMCLASGWAAAQSASLELTKDCELVLYSTIFHLPSTGEVAAPPDKSLQNCNIVFVESSLLTKTFEAHLRKLRWGIIPVKALGGAFKDMRKAAALPKLSPSLFFSPSVQHAVYVDLDRVLQLSLSNVAALLHDTGTNDRTALMLAIRHPSATNISALFSREEVHQNNKGSSKPLSGDLIAHQHQAYLTYQQASKIGLEYHHVLSSGLLVHNLRAVAGKGFRCLWYREYLDWSDRDDIAGTYTLSRRVYETDPVHAGAKSEWLKVAQGTSGYVRLLPAVNSLVKNHPTKPAHGKRPSPSLPRT
jgi:UDP-glucuronate 4-epimerase